MVARSVRHRRPAAVALSLALAPLALAPLALVPLIQGPAAQARVQDPPIPSEGELRELQQLVFACGRENSSGPCEQARRQADPLLDHPRLAGSCKDVLWQIREQAVVASENSFSRRERLDRTGADLLRLCQPRRPRPATPTPGPGTGSPGPRPMFGPSPNQPF
jgi:hypothetical protein